MPDPFVKSLLSEVARHLDRLIATGENAAIDLRSLPLSTEDRARLQQELGKGEVTITIDAGGVSEIHETAQPAVWWVRHYGAGQQVLTERIEIALIPETLVAAREDIAAGAARLKTHIETLGEGEPAHV